MEQVFTPFTRVAPAAGRPIPPQANGATVTPPPGFNLKPPPASARNHPWSRGRPLQAAPVPAVRAYAPNGGAPPSGGGFGHNGGPPMPPVTRNWGKHVLRGPEEYPVHRIQDQRFHIEKSEFPEGFDLQWVAISIWNQPYPTTEFAQMGWQPVETGEFDGLYDGRFVPATQPGPIVLEGLMLVARPETWSQISRARMEHEARSVVNIKMRQLAQGELERVTLNPQHKTALAFNHVTRSLEGIHVPVSPS